MASEREATRVRQGIGVVVCRCAEQVGAEALLASLRAAAQETPEVRVFTEVDDLCHRGRQALAELLAATSVDRLVVAACGRPQLEAGLTAALDACGLPRNMFVVANVLDQCQGLNGAAPAKAAAVLSRAIARGRNLRPIEAVSLEVVRRVLVLGNGPTAARLAAEAAALGLEVVLAGAEAEGLPSGVELLSGARLVAFRGQAGRFEAELEVDGESLRRQVGAAVVAYDYQVRPNFDLYGLTPSEAVVSLTELEALLATPEGMSARLAAQGLSAQGLSAVVLLSGLREEAHPAQTERLLRAALALRRASRPVYLAVRDVRVGAPGLEALYQECRRAGLVTFRFADTIPQLEQDAQGRARLRAIDEVLTLPVDLPPALVVVDEALEPVPELAGVARLMRLSLDAEGFPQANSVHRLSVATNRAGVLVVRGSRNAAATEADLAAAAADMAAATATLAALLGEEALTLEGREPRVHLGRCTACLTCFRLCPHGAIRITSRAEVLPAACQGCGVCAAECPMAALQLPGSSDDALAAELRAPVAVPAPRLVAFGCRRALEALSAGAGPVGALPVGLQLVEVPCAGRVGLTQLLDAFEAGAEGVLVVACHEGNCRSEQGSRHARLRVEEAGRLLAEIGLGAERVRFETLAPNQGARFRRLMRDFETRLAALGPSPLARPHAEGRES